MDHSRQLSDNCRCPHGAFGDLRKVECSTVRWQRSGPRSRTLGGSLGGHRFTWLTAERGEKRIGEGKASRGGRRGFASNESSSEWRRPAHPGPKRAGQRASGGLASPMHVHYLARACEGAVSGLARCGTWLSAHVSPQRGASARAKAPWRQVPELYESLRRQAPAGRGMPGRDRGPRPLQFQTSRCQDQRGRLGPRPSAREYVSTRRA